MEVRRGVLENIMVELYYKGQACVSGRGNSMNKGPVVGSMCPEVPRRETKEGDKEPGNEFEAKKVGRGQIIHRASPAC